MLPLLTLALCLALALPLVSGVTLLRRELADPRARCNDGTQAVYYHDQVRHGGGHSGPGPPD